MGATGVKGISPNRLMPLASHRVRAGAGGPARARFRMPAGPPVETVPAGIVEIDRLTGEFRRGRITEIAGTDSSGRTSLMLSTLAQQLHFAAHRGKNLAKATPAS